MTDISTLPDIELLDLPQFQGRTNDAGFLAAALAWVLHNSDPLGPEGLDAHYAARRILDAYETVGNAPRGFLSA